MVYFDRIPQELKNWDQWVCWKYEAKSDGSKTKVPYDPSTGQRADTTDQRTWVKFTEARSFYNEGKYDGIGFVFTKRDPYFGVDLDDCYTEGGDPLNRVTQPAADWVHMLCSYTEVSPSGKGLKVIAKGTLPETKRHSWAGGHGIYDAGRFFTITGNKYGFNNIRTVPVGTLEELYKEWFPPVATVQEYTEVPQRLTDTEVFKLANNAANASKFMDLYEGEYHSWYGTQGRSEADAGLISMLAFYTGPCPEQLDRMFRSSGLMRPKWDERRGEGTYGTQTIAMVLSKMEEYYDMAQRGTPLPPSTIDPYKPIILGKDSFGSQVLHKKWKKLLEGYDSLSLDNLPHYLKQVVQHVAPLSERLGDDWVILKSLSFLSALYGNVQVENRPLAICTIGISTQGTGKSATSDELERVVRAVASHNADNLSTFTGGSEAGLIRLIAGTRRRVLAYFSEWTSLAKLLGEDHSSRMRELLLNVWDGRSYTHTLATEVFQIREPFMVINGVTTPAAWKRTVDYSDTGNGFYSRYLFVAPDVLPATSEEYPYITQVKRDRIVTELYAHLEETPEVVSAVVERPSKAYLDYSKYLGISRTTQAIDLDDVGYSSEDATHMLPGARLLEQVKRVATVLELLESKPRVQGGVLRVREENVARAVVIVQRSAAYAQRAYAWLCRSKDDEQATVVRHTLARQSDTLLGLVQRTGLNAAEVERAINLLATENLVSSVVDGDRRIYSMNGGH